MLQIRAGFLVLTFSLLHDIIIMDFLEHLTEMVYIFRKSTIIFFCLRVSWCHTRCSLVALSFQLLDIRGKPWQISAFVLWYYSKDIPISLKLAVFFVFGEFFVAPNKTLVQFCRTDFSMTIVADATLLHGDIMMCATCVQNRRIISMSIAKVCSAEKLERSSKPGRERRPPSGKLRQK